MTLASAPAPFFATCAPGLEAVLLAEAQALKLPRSEAQRGGVQFEGTTHDAWRANLELRTAIRVLCRIARFEARDEDALYRGAQDVDWRRFVAPDGSLWIDARVKDSKLSHSQYVAQRVKDAIVDQLRSATGQRPNVDRERPDLRLNVHVWRNRTTISVDTSGDSLHKRGWRRAQGRAPLAETTAAALVELARWDRRAPLIDPFVGTGTLLIEAGLAAAGIAPGLFRESFGFERLPGHDEREYAAFVESVRARAQGLSNKQRLLGYDVDRDRIDEARMNADAAGLGDVVRFEVADVFDFAPRPGWNAWIVTNPPYGERLSHGEDLRGLYTLFGDRLREWCEGYTLGVLTTPPLGDELGFPGLERVPILNGGLDCDFVTGPLDDAALEPPRVERPTRRGGRRDGRGADGRRSSGRRGPAR